METIKPIILAMINKLAEQDPIVAMVLIIAVCLLAVVIVVFSSITFNKFIKGLFATLKKGIEVYEKRMEQKEEKFKFLSTEYEQIKKRIQEKNKI